MTEKEKEQLLVERAKTDITAFSHIYEKYFDKLYTYVYSYVRNHELSEDIVSETFEKALDNLHKYEYRGYSFGAWLYTIARNQALDRIKSRKKVLPIDVGNVLIIDSQSAENAAEELIVKEHLWGAIMELDDDTRELIVLRYIEGYSVRETAEIMNRTENAIKSAASRAVKKLKQILKQ